MRTSIQTLLLSSVKLAPEIEEINDIKPQKLASIITCNVNYKCEISNLCLIKFKLHQDSN